MRKLSQESKERKAAYDREFSKKNVTRKSIYFNKTDPEDVRMVEHLNQKGERRISGYVKGLIREDMEKSGE